MKIEFPISNESLAIMLQLTKITAPAMCDALREHFVDGLSQRQAAMRHGYSRQQLGLHVNNIKKLIKPAFDAYANCVNLQLSE